MPAQSTCSLPDCLYFGRVIKGMCPKHYNTAWARERRARSTPEEHERRKAISRASRNRYIERYRADTNERARQRREARRIEYPSLPGEEWRPVVGYEGWYEVSTEGRVRRVAAGTGTQVNRPVKPQFDRYGYLYVLLSRYHVPSRKMVHQLVAAAYIGPRPDGYTVNHEDGNKTNNRPANLTYMTSAENTRHAIALGLRPSRHR